MQKGYKLFRNTTLTEKTIMFMKEEKGLKQVESRTGKYKVFKGVQLFYFVGRSGAVRINTKNSVSGSRTQTDTFKKLVLDWANIQNPELQVKVK